MENRERGGRTSEGLSEEFDSLRHTAGMRGSTDESRSRSGAKSLVEMLRRSVERRGGNTAYGWKVDGEWRTLSYVGLWTKIKNTAAGLANLGIGRGDKVALVSTNRVEWPIVDFAAQSLGAVTVPVYPT
ncbi:MAG: AMP-binding protein, partial [Rubrobacter sp.]